MAETSFFSRSSAPRLIIVCKWRTNVKWKCWRSILLAELLHFKDLHRASADLCLLFQSSFASTLTQLLKLTNVLILWTIFGLQPTWLRVFPETFKQSSSAFAKQVWNWKKIERPFGVREIEYLGRTISPEGISPPALTIQNFLAKLIFAISKKALQRHLAYVKFCRKHIASIAEKFQPFYKLLEAETPNNITSFRIRSHLCRTKCPSCRKNRHFYGSLKFARTLREKTEPTNVL